MDPISLGVVLMVLGMGGTLLTLFVISLVVDLLKRLFPVEPPAPKPGAVKPTETASAPPAGGA
jgi:Na+-transporting methylmalonyl-CoA/oxaloacetate decarboxylase gamma subunit